MGLVDGWCSSSCGCAVSILKRRIFTPSAAQQVAIPFLHNNPRCALWASMGIGKSSSVATAIAADINYFGATQPTLIVGPLRVARDTWPNEFRKWQHLSDIEVAAMIGTPAERLQALHRDVPVHTINYENLPWLIDQLGDRWPYGRIVADESTRLKNFRPKKGGTYAGALGRVAHKSTQFWELTGTPAPNGLKDLWAQTWFLDAGVRLGRTYGAFEQRWFGFRRVKDAINAHKTHIQAIIFPGSDEEIHDRLKDICLTLNAKDYFDLREPFVNKIFVTLPRAARQRYKEMERELFTVLESGDDIEALSAAGKSLKCLQIAAGAAYVDDTGKWALVHEEKLDALDSIVQEAAGMPLLVSIIFKSDRERILAKYKGQAVDLSTEQGLAQFKSGECLIGVAHPASMGHGIDGLQEVTCQIVFFSLDWNMETHDQIIERIGPMRQHQSGFDRLVTVHYIMADDTIDEDVFARHISKRAVQDLLLDRMKRKS